MTRFRLRVNDRVLNEVLNNSTGETGQAMAAYAAQVTKEIKSVFRSRAGGAWWPISTTLFSGPRGAYFTATVRATRPHRIVARNAPNLVFFWQREGRMFVGPSVNHPGSSPPEELVLSGIQRAGRTIQFVGRAVPRVL